MQAKTDVMIPWDTLKAGELLGQGNRGRIHRGQWNNQPVALKHLHVQKLPNFLVKAWIQEVAVLRGLSSPYVVQLYGLCTEVAHYSLVMVYMPKGSLYDLLHNPQEEVPWHHRWTMALAIGQGLAYLHQCNIVHGNLKSTNVLLDTGYQAKLTDIGISTLNQHRDLTGLPQNRSQGTLRWLAPEQLKRHGYPTQASDIYSYGMVLWEIASRQLPYAEAFNETVIMAWILKGEKEIVPQDCPPSYRQIIEQTWKAPENRPSAHILCERLIQAEREPRIPLPVWHAVQTQQLAPGENYALFPAHPIDIQKVLVCYHPHPVPGYSVNRVEVIYNPILDGTFENQINKLQLRHQNETFFPQWAHLHDACLRQKSHDNFMKFTTPYRDTSAPHIKLFPAWHGTMADVSSIFTIGYVSLGTTDEGLFGKGIYSTLEAEYAYRVYAREGKGALLLNWVAIFSAYPVIDGDVSKLKGKGNYQNYDAHFAPVVPQDPADPHETLYYPCTANQSPQYHEVVVFESAAVLPRYRVHLKKDLLPMPPRFGEEKLPCYIQQYLKQYPESQVGHYFFELRDEDIFNQQKQMGGKGLYPFSPPPPEGQNFLVHFHRNAFFEGDVNQFCKEIRDIILIFEKNHLEYYEPTGWFSNPQRWKTLHYELFCLKFFCIKSLYSHDARDLKGFLQVFLKKTEQIFRFGGSSYNLLANMLNQYLKAQEKKEGSLGEMKLLFIPELEQHKHIISLETTISTLQTEKDADGKVYEQKEKEWEEKYHKLFKEKEIIQSELKNLQNESHKPSTNNY